VRAGGALVLLMLCACSPSTQPQPAYRAPDCSLGFEADAKLLTGQSGLAPAVREPGEPYSFHNAEDGSVSYVITEPSAPAHPAILMQRAAGGTSTTGGCAYGDKAEFDKLKAYIESLKSGG
jgi:hypothetical protein